MGRVNTARKRRQYWFKGIKKSIANFMIFFDANIDDIAVVCCSNIGTIKKYLDDDSISIYYLNNSLKEEVGHMLSTGNYYSLNDIFDNLTLDKFDGHFTIGFFDWITQLADTRYFDPNSRWRIPINEFDKQDYAHKNKLGKKIGLGNDFKEIYNSSVNINSYSKTPISDYVSRLDEKRSQRLNESERIKNANLKYKENKDTLNIKENKLLVSKQDLDKNSIRISNVIESSKKNSFLNLANRCNKEITSVNLLVKYELIRLLCNDGFLVYQSPFIISEDYLSEKNDVCQKISIETVIRFYYRLGDQDYFIKNYLKDFTVKRKVIKESEEDAKKMEQFIKLIVSSRKNNKNIELIQNGDFIQRKTEYCVEKFVEYNQEGLRQLEITVAKKYYSSLIDALGKTETDRFIKIFISKQLTVPSIFVYRKGEYFFALLKRTGGSFNSNELNSAMILLENKVPVKFYEYIMSD
jgi:hypothetical protein